MKKKLPVLLLLLCLVILHANAQCSPDIFAVNDQSGSVDATENKHSRDFILKPAQAHTPGNGNSVNNYRLIN